MIATSARAQTVLVGVRLPASRQELMTYAREQSGEPEVLDALARLPDREYGSIDEVGEELAPVQPQRREEQPRPRSESGDPPGGREYTNPHPEPGAVRPG